MSPKRAMNKSTIKTLFAAALCAAFATSCGSSSSKAALAWKGESRSVSISDTVAIDLRSVPGPLWFGKTEVTQAQWEAVMGDNPSRFKNPDNPVEQVSWSDCQWFLERLNALPAVKESGLTFRLPTEEEWERACRAGATGDYCLLADGTEITESTLGQVAWFRDNSDETTHPVGQKKPNAFGLYDMHGNVAEWTSTNDGGDRVFRNGSWLLPAWDCASAYRRSGGQFRDRSDTRGFRLCADAAAPKTSDGGSVTMSEPDGFGRIDADAKADAERKAREAAERSAAEEARAKERASRVASSPAVKAAESILSSMVDIPGKGFKMGKTEVTQSQWEAVTGGNPSRFWNPSEPNPNNPVESVSWDDCQKFLKKFNALPFVKESGLTFRLPTEEEWEYACRAGATGDYCCLADGTEITKSTLGQVAWFEDNADETTHPVGQKQPNAFGLYDMHGNVAEWTSTADGEDRVSRGGSLESWPRDCASSVRYGFSPDGRFSDLGFRLCAEPNGK